MTEISFPWSGTTAGGAPGDAGPYSDDEFSQWVQQAIMYSGDIANLGVIRGFSTELEVGPTSPASANVQVLAGAAIIQGRWYYNDSTVTIPVAANASGNPRIDLIILEVDFNAQTVRLDILQGTPAPSPAVPSLTQNALVWQIPLASLTAASGFVSIAFVSDLRQYCNTPNQLALEIVNNAAGGLGKSTVNIHNVAAPGSIYHIPVTTNTTTNNPIGIGVTETTTLSGGGAGRNVMWGIVSVFCTQATTVGDLLWMGTTAGFATNVYNPASHTLPFGRVIVGAGAGGRPLVFVNFLASHYTKQILQPSYDSGWFAVAAATLYTLAHGLGNTPRKIELWYSAVAAPTGANEVFLCTVIQVPWTGGVGGNVSADGTNVYAETGPGGGGGGAILHMGVVANTGYYRVYVWSGLP